MDFCENRDILFFNENARGMSRIRESISCRHGIAHTHVMSEFDVIDGALYLWI